MLQRLKTKALLNVGNINRDVRLTSEAKIMLNSMMFRKVAKDVFDNECFLNRDTKGYELYIDADYRDCIDNGTIREILNKDSKDERIMVFNEFILDSYGDYAYDLISDIVNEIEERLNELSLDYDRNDIRDYIYEKVDIQYPYNHFLKQQVCANLVVNTGDANLEFSANTLRYMDEEFQEESSIKWLAIQQGYSIDELNKAIFDTSYIPESKFLYSLYTELLNATSYMNALTFLIDATLEELIYFDKNELDSVVVKKGTTCGLVDFWYGAGGPLEVELDKDVVIPTKFIHNLTIDGGIGSYSIYCTYGMNKSAWNGELIKNKTA